MQRLAGWITFEWLGVESPYQRQGIGRWLLSEQLRRQAQRGIANAILWTEPDNRAMRRIGECWALAMGQNVGCLRTPFSSRAKRAGRPLPIK